MIRLASGVRLGRLPATHNPKALWLAKYLNRSTVKVPDTVPLDMSVTATGPMAWVMDGMFANGPDPAAPAQIAATGIGDCFWVAMARRAQLAGMSVGKPLWTSYADMLAAILKGYSDATGWDVNNSDATDQGTNPTKAWPYLQNVGLLCSDGSYDKIGAVVQVNPSDIEELLIAFNIAGGMSIGVQLPGAWEHSDVWDDTNSAIVGGHEIPAFSDLKVEKNGAIVINTWGSPRIVTAAALGRFCNQATVFIGKDALGPGGANVAGFDSEQMLADAQATQGIS